MNILNLFCVISTWVVLDVIALDLDGEYHRCDALDGDNVEVPRITVDPCIQCTCTSGLVTCQNKRRTCPRVSCSNLQRRQPGTVFKTGFSEIKKLNKTKILLVTSINCKSCMASVCT